MSHHEKTKNHLVPNLLIGALLTGNALFMSGCASSSQSASAAVQQAIPVNLMTVQKQNYQDATELMAQVNSKHATDIHAQVNGRILNVLVSDGQQVHEGQPLFQLDENQQSATVQSLSAIHNASLQEPEMLRRGIDGLKAELLGAKADLEFSRKQLGRYKSLVDEQAVSERETEQYQADVTIREQKINSIKASIASLEAKKKAVQANIRRDAAALASANTNLSYFTVRAPFSGVVGTLVAKEGDVIDPATTLTTLTDNRNLEIDVAVSADERPRIHMGMAMQLLTMNDKALGTLETIYIAPKVDPDTQTFLLKGKLKNSKDELAMDQHLKVHLVWGNHLEIMIPVSAVSYMDGLPFVYQAISGTARLQTVQLGDINGENVVVQSGLKAGDVIVTGGIQKLQDGAAISQAKN